MRLVHKQQKVIRKVVQQRPRCLPLLPPIHVSAVVFNAGAVPHFRHHLQVVQRALAQSLGFQQLAVGLQLLDPLFELGLNIADRQLQLFARGDEVLGRKDVDRFLFDQQLAGKRIDLDHPLDLVPPKLDAIRRFRIGGKDFKRIAPYSKGAAVKVDIVALELEIDQLT